MWLLCRRNLISQDIHITGLIDIYENLLSETNEASGFRVVTEDAACLLNDSELAAVMKEMKLISDYCNVGFITYPADGCSDISSLSKAHLWGKLVFDDLNPYVVFIIDVKARYLSVYSSFASSVISSEKINAIMDEVYLYATNEEYETCACKTFGSILKILEDTKRSVVE